MIKDLVLKLQSLLAAIPNLQETYTYERADSDGTPFATITPSANESAYQTTTENHRTYAFMIRLFVERAGQSNPADCEVATRDLVDQVLDSMDRNWALSGMSMPAGYTLLFMEAAPSKWGYVGKENEYRVAEVMVRVHFSVDVNLI